jgi:hypothetical protein
MAKNDFIPKLTGTKFTSGVYRGAYSAVEMGKPSRYDVIGQKLNRSDAPDPFVRTASSESFESSGVIGGEPAPDVGSTNDGRSTRR